MVLYIIFFILEHYPSSCDSTNRPNQPVQKNCCSFVNRWWNLYILLNWLCPKPVKHSLIYVLKHHSQPFGLGGALKLWSTTGDSLHELITTIVLPGLEQIHQLLRTTFLPWAIDIRFSQGIVSTTFIKFQARAICVQRTTRATLEFSIEFLNSAPLADFRYFPVY